MPAHYKSFNFFVHKVELFDVGPRLPFFNELLKGKKTLHVGCTDWPIFQEENNLHIKLAQQHQIHGLDLDKEGIENLKKYVDCKFYSSYQHIDESYDLVLAPEVIEHTLNPGLFMKQLLEIDCKEIVITAPNAIGHIQNNPKFGFKEVEGQEIYLECVHPDHNAFYSPMTLANTVLKSIEEYSDNAWSLIMIFVTESTSQVGCIIQKKVR
ncbi:MAG: hypothetical protein HRT88_19495 [Lentisphaeraceae bacterium]|nr:hypothetical protein [Lentisphaeraceae bacterium]